MSTTSGLGSQPRQRRWSAKVKTGCTTCRTRRVKCDEAKPVCGNCTIKARPCDISGETLVRSRKAKSLSPPTKHQPASKTIREAPADPARAVVARRASHHLGHDVTPEGWDWAEACEYWNSVLPMAQEQDLLLPSEFAQKPSKINWSPDPTNTVFIMGSLAHNMSRTCRLLKSNAQAGAIPEVARMREKYSRYMGEELQRLNQDIANPETYGATRVFGRLIGLIVSEIDTNSPNLRLHTQGFITLLTVSGGAQKVLERKEANILAIIHVMVSATVLNTTSPATDMISGEFLFTNQDVYSCYAFTLHLSFPCPTHLFLCLRDVNRLRHQIASRGYSDGLIQAAAHSIFENIAAFNPDQWLERYEMPRASFRATLARIFQVAVALYAKLVLAQHAGIDYEKEHRLAEASHLIHVIASVRDIVPQKIMCWPLIVAGAALAMGTFEDKAMVEEMLYGVGSRSDASDGPLEALEMLRTFWLSGKTSWDECFARPIFPLTE